MQKDGASANNFGLMSVIFGISGLVLSLTIPLFGTVSGIVFAILGIVFGVIQLRRNKNSWTITGLIISGVALVVSVVLLFLVISGLVEFVRQIQELQAQGLLDPTSLGGSALAQ